MAVPLPLLLLLLGVLCGPTAGFIDGRVTQQRASDVLTEKLFTVADMLTQLEQHVQRLDRWEGSTTLLESRLTALENGQGRLADQLALALRRLENVSADASTIQSDLSAVAGSQTSFAAQLGTLRTDLTQAVSGVAGSVSGLTDAQAVQHERTRGACQAGVAGLEEPLSGLRTAITAATEQADRTETALTDGLGRVEGTLQESSSRLEGLSEQLRQDREARLITTTPAPTADPQQAFLNSLYRSLKRRGNE